MPGQQENTTTGTFEVVFDDTTELDPNTQLKTVSCLSMPAGYGWRHATGAESVETKTVRWYKQPGSHAIQLVLGADETGGGAVQAVKTVGIFLAHKVARNIQAACDAIAKDLATLNQSIHTLERNAGIIFQGASAVAAQLISLIALQQKSAEQEAHLRQLQARRSDFEQEATRLMTELGDARVSLAQKQAEQLYLTELNQLVGTCQNDHDLFAALRTTLAKAHSDQHIAFQDTYLDSIRKVLLPTQELSKSLTQKAVSSEKADTQTRFIVMNLATRKWLPNTGLVLPLQLSSEQEASIDAKNHLSVKASQRRLDDLSRTQIAQLAQFSLDMLGDGRLGVSDIHQPTAARLMRISQVSAEGFSIQIRGPLYRPNPPETGVMVPGGIEIHLKWMRQPSFEKGRSVFQYFPVLTGATVSSHLVDLLANTQIPWGKLGEKGFAVRCARWLAAALHDADTDSNPLVKQGETTSYLTTWTPYVGGRSHNPSKFIAPQVLLHRYFDQIFGLTVREVQPASQTVSDKRLRAVQTRAVAVAALGASSVSAGSAQTIESGDAYNMSLYPLSGQVVERGHIDDLHEGDLDKHVPPARKIAHAQTRAAHEAAVAQQEMTTAVQRCPESMSQQGQESAEPKVPLAKQMSLTAKIYGTAALCFLQAFLVWIMTLILLILSLVPLLVLKIIESAMESSRVSAPCVKVTDAVTAVSSEQGDIATSEQTTPDENDASSQSLVTQMGDALVNTLLQLYTKGQNLVHRGQAAIFWNVDVQQDNPQQSVVLSL